MANILIAEDDIHINELIHNKNIVLSSVRNNIVGRYAISASAYAGAYLLFVSTNQRKS